MSNNKGGGQQSHTHGRSATRVRTEDELRDANILHDIRRGGLGLGL